MDTIFARTIAARDQVRVETWQQLDGMPATPQDTPAPVLSVSYMKVPAGGVARYMELEELWKKIHQVRINDGTLANWELYSRVFPGGSDYPYNYATVDGYGAFKDMNVFDMESVLEKAGLRMSATELGDRTTEARDQVRIEVWYLVDYVQASGQ